MSGRIGLGIYAILIVSFIGCEVINYSQELRGPFVVTAEFQEIPLKRPLVVYRYFNDLCYQIVRRETVDDDIPPAEVEITYGDKSVMNYSKFHIWGERVCVSLADFKNPSKIVELRVRSSQVFSILSFEWLTSNKS